MATKGKSQQDKKESFIEILGAVGISLSILIALIWFLGSHKIVYYTAPLLWGSALPWHVIDNEKWARLNEAYVYYRTRPGDISLSLYLSYANTCLKPLAVFISVAAVCYVSSLFLSSSNSAIRRRLKPMEAATEISKVFPAIIPVLHLGPALIKNELPLWRRQTFPEDVWKSQIIDRRPMVENGALNLDRVATYFRGGEPATGKLQLRGKRRWSSMLGYQVVDLIADSSKGESIVFADRFSPQGKVIFALLCAHAFGGREGKIDYKKAAEQINRSCAGQKNGLPNLTVAQWLYDKYRANEKASRLFAVHHWEYSYLFALFFKAKLTGKVTHTDFIWLKPLDRILFYVLNTVGRSTPPVEAAAVYSQYDYEVKVAKSNRLPLVMRDDGQLVHHIAVGTAVEGFQHEFIRFQQSSDDADNWWQDLQTWSGADQIVQKLLRQSKLEVNEAILNAQNKEGLADMNAYEAAASRSARKVQEELDRRSLEEIARSVGVTGGVSTGSGPDLF